MGYIISKQSDKNGFFKVQDPLRGKWEVGDLNQHVQHMEEAIWSKRQITSDLGSIPQFSSENDKKSWN